MRRRTTRTGPDRAVDVLYVANSAKIGGGNRVLMDLIAGLDRTRFEPHLVLPSPGQLADWAEGAGVDCQVIADGDWNGRIGLARRTGRLVTAVVRSRSSVIHANSHTCYRAAGLAGRLTGAVRVCHLGFPPELEELRWSFRWSPEVVIGCHDQQADAVAEQLKVIGSGARAVAVPNGIDLTAFSPRSETYEKPAWCPAGRVVLIVGHLSAVKGYPTFFDAAAEVAATGEDCTFVVIGGETSSPGYSRFLQEYVADLGLTDRVRFLGWRDDVADALRAADLVVLPSLAEGLPLVILEAMACGRPVVGAAVGGIPEAIRHDATGLLVPPGDAPALARAMLTILRNEHLARRLGTLAREDVVRRFGTARFVSAIESLYEELLEPNAPGHRAQPHA